MDKKNQNPLNTSFDEELSEYEQDPPEYEEEISASV